MVNVDSAVIVHAYLSGVYVLCVVDKTCWKCENNLNERKVRITMSGEKNPAKPSQGAKRFSDVVPEGNIAKAKLTIHDLVDEEIVVTTFTEAQDKNGMLRGLNMAFTHKGKELTVFVDKQRVIDKLFEAKGSLPLKGKVVKGGRFFDIL